MTVDVKAAAKLLLEHDDILILTHKKPDPDTLGSAFSLLWAMEKLGKRARVQTPDEFPERYRFIVGEYTPEEFEPRFCVSVDVANPDLLGELAPVWAEKLDLCVDHHIKNTITARYMLVLPEYPAAAQIAYAIIGAMGVPFDARMATAIFAGLAADTGCFKFDNVSAYTHRAAADMIDAGADHGRVNMRLFDQKSRGRVELDKIVYNTLEYHFGGLCAIITIESGVVERCGVTDAELDGISGYPRMIEGVQIGITLHEKTGLCRVSVRVRNGLDASVFCSWFGGGGHKGAGGCSIDGSLADAREKLLPAVEKHLRESGLSWD